MTRDELLDLCLEKPGAAEDYPFGDDVTVVKVAGKMFALCSLEADPPRVNLKCDPERALLLRDRYDAVLPGYHMDKRHWNTVVCDGTIPDAEIRELVDHSYELVVAKLAKRVRENLGRQASTSTAVREVLAAADGLPGVSTRPSRFVDGPGWLIDGREFLHVDSDGTLDLRLTKPLIREHRDLLDTDDRVTLRSGDWVSFDVRGPEDADDAIDLVGWAAEANRRA